MNVWLIGYLLAQSFSEFKYYIETNIWKLSRRREVVEWSTGKKGEKQDLKTERMQIFGKQSKQINKYCITEILCD